MHVKPPAKSPIAILFLLFNSKDYLSDPLRKVRKSYRIIELVQPLPVTFRIKWDVSLF
jgi:hypothetical protein